MGFLSGLAGGSKTNVPASGFYAMPGEYRDLWTNILGNATSTLPQIGSDAFKPLPTTADESRAFDTMRAGYSPTAESLKTDIGMLMNPFDQYVMNDINDAANSDFSILKQNMNQAGQFGSNRQQLGASDIENKRINTIGNFRQSQYNNALNQVFNNLIPNRQADTQNLLSIGNFDRTMDAGNKQAPLQSIMAQLGMLGSVPTSFGNFGSPATTVKTGGGIGGLFDSLGKAGDLAKTGYELYTLFSDIRLKENIQSVGTHNGFNLYEFNYIGDGTRCVGVMAHEVEEVAPEAVIIRDGYKMVNYAMIGMEMYVV